MDQLAVAISTSHAEQDPMDADSVAHPPLNDAEGVNRVQELALRQLNRFLSYEAKVLKGDDDEAVHDMRVASRRLQQVLDLLYPKPRSAQVRQLRRKIRRLRQALGEVRNCDVLLQLVRRCLARKRSARREAWTALQEFLEKRRTDSFRHTLRQFSRINLTGFYVDLKELLGREKAHADASDNGHDGVIASSGLFQAGLSSALDSTWRRFEDQLHRSHHHPQPEVVHAARIATKRLRYLIEIFHELQIPGSAEALIWLRDLQKHLGDWHDLEVLEEMMIQMVARPSFLREHLPLAVEVEKLVLRNRRTKLEFEAKYSRMSMDSAELRRLKEWVSYRLGSASAVLASD